MACYSPYKTEEAVTKQLCIGSFEMKKRRKEKPGSKASSYGEQAGREEMGMGACKRVENHVSVCSPDRQNHSQSPHALAHPKINKSPHRPGGTKGGAQSLTVNLTVVQRENTAAYGGIQEQN